MFLQVSGFILFLLTPLTIARHAVNDGAFPKTLKFGVSTSAFQIEGAWNEDGKGVSIWDTFTHSIPSPVADGSNGDIACDSYHKYKEDIAAAANMGVNLYRFSFAWTRILPNGYAKDINQKGIEYYRNVVQEILKHNMEPVATLYHWDLPQKLMDDGIDWTNETIVDAIVDYARIMFKNFPEIAFWNTINEPKQVCHFGYGTGLFAPGFHGDGKEEYICTKLVLKAHAAIYRMYKKEFPNNKGRMTIANDCMWMEPKTDSPQDKAAAERQIQFECGLYYHPIFKGDWPPLVKKRILDRSLAAGLKQSRLPDLTPDEIEFIKGTHDYLALNHYYSVLVEPLEEGPANDTGYIHDIGVINSARKDWIIQSNGVFTIVPWGFKKVLEWLKKEYGDNDIVVTEVGMTEDGSTLNDDIRIEFYIGYFCNMLEAIKESNVKVIGVVAWALLDNFEWTNGYAPHFGLYAIDFNDPNRTRRPKKSVEFFKKLTQTRRLYCNKERKYWPGPVDVNSKPLVRAHWHTGLAPNFLE